MKRTFPSVTAYAKRHHMMLPDELKFLATPRMFSPQSVRYPLDPVLMKAQEETDKARHSSSRYSHWCAINASSRGVDGACRSRSGFRR